MSLVNSTTSELSPVMDQYLSIKQQYKDILLFYRMGDFYELFYSDAEIVAKELNIVLTKKQIKNANIPMCGVPFHAYEHYLHKLIKLGYKVAICEQMETPEEAKKRGYKAVIDRKVVRVITPGTITEDNLLASDGFNYLAAIQLYKNNAIIAWVDISTGDFFIQTINIAELLNVLARVNPKEIIVNEKQINKFNDLDFYITTLSSEKFNFISSKNTLESFFQNINILHLEEQEILIAGVLLDYIILTQKSSIPRLTNPKIWNELNTMRMDFFTRQSLEINTKLNGGEEGSLKSVLNKTVTKSGTRLLKEWINSPLVDIKLINERLEVVEYFVNNQAILDKIRDILKTTPDLIRILGRITLNRGTPRDLLALKQGLNNIILVQNELIISGIPNLLQQILSKPKDTSKLFDMLNRSILDMPDLPLSNKEGGFIKNGYNAELDFIKNNKQNLLKKVIHLQEKYIAQTTISALKIQFNNILGYYIEVPSKLAAKLLESNHFIHKQTLSTNARFTSQELLELESEIVRDVNKSSYLEQSIFLEIVTTVVAYAEAIIAAGETLAIIDILAAFAILAIECDLTKPVIDNSTMLNIVEGRHLVVEQSLKNQLDIKFMPNDCRMNQTGNLFLITGPNMAGKSTFLRQNAIIIILAQVGCYVPAKSAHIGVVDAIFSRVGAGDNLYKGQSTFMVEMLETSIILNNATEKSFIILDEIGRGTATYDGLSIAFAVAEYLHEVNKSRILFATHYHELAKLQNKLNRIKLYNMVVKSEGNNLVFMHQVAEGVANKSYGIHVAKLAGMPKALINNANNILHGLENKSASPNMELPLFNDNQTNSGINNNDTQIIDILTNIDVDNLSPKEALNVLYNLKSKLN
ncbi:DNA mismatch repair protein MutS [Rickettsiales bacterium LUAb2]